MGYRVLDMVWDMENVVYTEGEGCVDSVAFHVSHGVCGIQ